ncbi:glycosyltransferase family 2 protein [Streptococcus agalactiae]|uniref:glycosyltransferase family 2 protein n=1 Tax=Streptococcus agalactiae TaxID=1311 RepID=UPI00085C76E6|nr:glycosyltransferase family 2 protein [Streptococcus agalactiae]
MSDKFSNKISVIVPLYNVEKYIINCISSLTNQTYQNIEIILIDDGSTDNSGRICKKLAQEDHRIIYLRKENGGVSSARNLGLQYATGSYIGFVDSDDYISKTMYENLLKRLLETNADIAETDFALIDNRFTKKKRKKIQKVLNKEEAIREFLSGNVVENNLVIKLFKKTVIANLKFKEDVIVGEDMLFSLQALQNSDRVTVDTTNADYFYVVRSNSTMNTITEKDIDNLSILEQEFKKIDIPQLKSYLEAKLIREKVKFVSRVLISNKAHLYSDIIDRYLQEVRHYSIKNMINFLSSKHCLAITIMKISPKLYTLLYKVFQKQ